MHCWSWASKEDCFFSVLCIDSWNKGLYYIISPPSWAVRSLLRFQENRLATRTTGCYMCSALCTFLSKRFCESHFPLTARASLTQSLGEKIFSYLSKTVLCPRLEPRLCSDDKISIFASNVSHNHFIVFLQCYSHSFDLTTQVLYSVWLHTAWQLRLMSRLFELSGHALNLSGASRALLGGHYERGAKINKLNNVWFFVQLIHRPTRTEYQLYKNPNIA